MTRLVLCRHAQAGNVKQVRRLGRALARPPLAAVYTSPLERARETAHAVAAEHRLVPVVVPDLREIELGEVEGLQFEEYSAALQAELLRHPLTVRFPGGETFAEVQVRVCAALDEIVARHPGDRVAVVAHAGSIRAAFARWLGIRDERIFRLDQRFAAVNIVDWIEGAPIVRLLNSDTPSDR